MKPILRLVTCLCLSAVLCTAQGQEKPILVVTTDIGQDPDDLQSLIRLLHYSNEFDLRGLIANADQNYAHEPPILRDSIIYACLNAYEQIESKLKVHDADYPTAAALRKVVKPGCTDHGTQVPIDQYIGEGRSTEGSDHILKVVAEARQPVHIAVWGGGADLAQALWKVRSKCRPEHLPMFMEKLRVYFIGKQDSSVEWMMEEFPEMWKIVAFDRDDDKWESTYRGIFYGGNMELTSKEWLQENILSSNPLAALYPLSTYTGGPDRNPHGAMKEGDTPSWFYFLDNGLNMPEDPTAGGWGGRFEQVAPNLFLDAQDRMFDVSRDSVWRSQRATVFRWREDFQNDFAARAQWGRRDYRAANHHPVILIKNCNPEGGPVYKSVPAGNSIILDACESRDPDKDEISYDWTIYPEAGTYPYAHQLVFLQDEPGKLELSAPLNARGHSIHLILRIVDNGKPSLATYQRIILEVE